MPRWRGVRRNIAVGSLSVLLTLGTLYAGLCWCLWAYDRAFVFYQLKRPPIAPEAAGLHGFSRVEVPTEDGLRLFGWWRPPDPGDGVVVLLTGTGVTLQDYAPLIGDLARQGLGVIGIDYRGNGASPGEPSEAGWRDDARAAFDYAHAAAPEARIAVLGQSMGTGFAVGLAVERPVAGVLLESAYASVARLFELHGVALLPGVPLPGRLLVTDQIDSEKLIGRMRSPLLMLHGSADRRIPIAEARRLFAAAHEPKEFIEVPGAAHAAAWFGPYRERALAALTAWTRGPSP